MYDNYATIAIGFLLIVVSFTITSIAYGMPSRREKPWYPATPRLRIAVFLVGVLFVIVGLARLLGK